MQDCLNCDAGELKIIAAILKRPVIEKILTYLGLDRQSPPRGGCASQSYITRLSSPASRHTPPCDATISSRHG